MLAIRFYSPNGATHYAYPFDSITQINNDLRGHRSGTPDHQSELIAVRLDDGTWHVSGQDRAFKCMDIMPQVPRNPLADDRGGICMGEDVGVGDVDAPHVDANGGEITIEADSGWHYVTDDDGVVAYVRDEEAALFIQRAVRVAHNRDPLDPHETYNPQH